MSKEHSVELLVERTAAMYGIQTEDFDTNKHVSMHTKVLVQCTNCSEVFIREYGFLQQKHDCVRESTNRYFDPGLMPRIEVLRQHPDAKIPHRSRSSDAGWDMHSLVDVKIYPGQIVNINTGVVVVAPHGFYFTVEGRSSMFQSGVVPFRGIIDAGYTGPMIITLMNVSSVPYSIKKGDRVAQIIPHKSIPMDFMEVDSISPEYNIRGTNGYGSSGK